MTERKPDGWYIERADCPKCGSPRGQPCKTPAGNVAGGNHVARYAAAKEAL